LLDTFFSQNDLSPELVALKDQAYALAFIKSAARAYLASLFDEGKSDLVAAIDADNSFKDEGYQELTDLLIGWALSPQSKEPESYLVDIRNNLPASLESMKPALSKAIAKVILKPLFEGTTHIRHADKWALLRAIRYDPSWLLNRGVIRMLAETWLPLRGEIR